MTNLQLVPETVKVNAPSISSSAMLVELSIGIWEGRKKDRRASAAVTSSNNASRGIATVNKKLLGDCPELEAIKAFVSMVRQWNIRCTLPWATRGPRLLTNAQFFDYQSGGLPRRVYVGNHGRTGEAGQLVRCERLP